MYVDPAASQMHAHKYTHILHNICTDAHTHTMAAALFLSVNMATPLIPISRELA